MLKKNINRIRRKNRIRSKVSGTAKRPRLSIFRSNSNIYAQIIDDNSSKTLISSSDIKIKNGTKTDMAKKVGQDIASKAKNLKIEKIVFDRGGFAYHGRVKALADSAKETGLKF